VRSLIEEGIARGEFADQDVNLAGFAILGSSTGFQNGITYAAPRTAQEVAVAFAVFLLPRGLGSPVAVAGANRGSVTVPRAMRRSATAATASSVNCERVEQQSCRETKAVINHARANTPRRVELPLGDQDRGAKPVEPRRTRPRWHRPARN